MSASEVFEGEENPPPQDNPARGSTDDEAGCCTCKILSKKLKASREWNRFYQMKLENTDKLLHIVADYEREKQHNVELQLAYDQRTRESSYIREQMANLLLEVEPLREKLRVLEKRLEEEVKRRERAENQEQGLLFSIEQQKHQISSMREKVDTNLIEILEKKITAARSEIKRLKSIIDDKSCEISELKDFNADRRLHYERNNKKALWSLKLAREYGLLLHEQGCLPGGLTSAVWYRLQSLLEVSESILQSQYHAFQRKQEKRCKKNSVEMAALPSLESWLDDFDVGLGDELFEEEDDNLVKNSRKKVLAKEAKQLEELIQDISDNEIGSKGRDKVCDQDQQKMQVESEGLTKTKISDVKQELEQKLNESLNSKTTKIVKAPSEVAKHDCFDENVHHEFKNKHSVRQGRSTKEQKQLPVVSSELYLEDDESDSSNDNSRAQNDCAVKRKSCGKERYIACEAKLEDHTDIHKTRYISASHENLCEEKIINLDVGNANKDSSDELTQNQAGDNTMTHTVEELQFDSKNDSTNLTEEVDNGEDIIRQILNDMKPHDKLDCLDSSFCLQDSEDSLLSEEKKRDRTGRNVDKTQERHLDMYEDDDIIGPVSDSSDDASHDVPKTLVSQVSQGFSVADSNGEKVDSMLEDLGITDSDVSDEEEKLPTDRSTRLLQRFRNDFKSSQSFSIDIDDQINTPPSDSISAEDPIRKDDSTFKDRGSGSAEYVIGIKRERSRDLASHIDGMNSSADDQGILSSRGQFSEQNYEESNLTSNDNCSINNIISNTESRCNKHIRSSDDNDSQQGSHLATKSASDKDHLAKYDNLTRDIGSINESSQMSFNLTKGICLYDNTPCILSERDKFKEQNDMESDPISKDCDYSNDNSIGQVVDPGNVCSKPNKPRLQELRHIHNVVNDSAEVDEHELVSSVSLTKDILKKEEYQKLKSSGEDNMIEKEKVKLTETFKAEHLMIDIKRSSVLVGSKEDIEFIGQKLLNQTEAESEKDVGPLSVKGDCGACAGVSIENEEQSGHTKFMFSKESCRTSTEGAGTLREDKENLIIPISNKGHSERCSEYSDDVNKDQVGTKEIMIPKVDSDSNENSVVDVNIHKGSSTCLDQGSRQNVKKQQEQQLFLSSPSKNGRHSLEDLGFGSPQNFDDLVVMDNNVGSDLYTGDKLQNMTVPKNTIRLDVLDKLGGEPSSVGIKDRDTEEENVDCLGSNSSSLASKEKIKVDQDKKEKKKSGTTRILLDSPYFDGGSNVEDKREMNGVDVLEKRIMSSVNMKEMTVIESIRPENDDSDKETQDKSLHIDRACTKYRNEVSSLRKEIDKENISNTNVELCEYDSEKDINNQILSSRNDESLYTNEEDFRVAVGCNSSKLETTDTTDNEISFEKISDEDPEYKNKLLPKCIGHISTHDPVQLSISSDKEQQSSCALPQKKKLKAAPLATDILLTDESLRSDDINKEKPCDDNKRTPGICKISVSEAAEDEPAPVDSFSVDTYDTYGCGSETEDSCQMRVCRRSSRRIAALEKKKLINQEIFLQKFHACKKKSDQFPIENLESQNNRDNLQIMNDKEKENKQSSICKESPIQDIKDKTEAVAVGTEEEFPEIPSKVSRVMKPLNAVSNQPGRILFNWGPKLQVPAKVHVEKNIKFFQRSKLTSVVADLYSTQTYNVFSLENRKRRAQKRMSVSVAKVNELRPQKCYLETTDDHTYKVFSLENHKRRAQKRMKVSVAEVNVPRPKDCVLETTDDHLSSVLNLAEYDYGGMNTGITDCRSMKRESIMRNLKSLKRESRKRNNSPDERQTSKRKDSDRRSLPQTDEIRKRVARSQNDVESCTFERKASQRSLFGSESSSNVNSSSCLEETSPVHNGPKQRNRRRKEFQDDSRNSRGRLKFSKINVEFSRSKRRKSESSGDRSSSPDFSSSSQDSCRKEKNTQSKTAINYYVRKSSVSTRGSSFPQKRTLTKPLLAETDACIKRNFFGKKNHIDSSDSDISSGAQERIKRCKGKRRSCFVTSETDDSEIETSNILTKTEKRNFLVKKKTELFRASKKLSSGTDPKGMMERKTQPLMLDSDISLKSVQYRVDPQHDVKQLDSKQCQGTNMISEIAPEPETSIVSWETCSDGEAVNNKDSIKSNKAKQVKGISTDGKSDSVVCRKKSVFEIASRLSANHIKIQENKRTAILLDTAPQSASKRQRKKSFSKALEKYHSQALEISEEHRESQGLETPVYSQEKGKIRCLLPEFDSSDTDDSENVLEVENQYDSQSEKVLTLNERTVQSRVVSNDSEEMNDALKDESSLSKHETQIVSHPGLVSSLARLGTLDRPRVKPKPVMKKSIPKAHVPASSGFVENLFCRRIKDAKWYVSNESISEAVRSSYQPINSRNTSFDPPPGKSNDALGNVGKNKDINQPGCSTPQVTPSLPQFEYSTDEINVSSENGVSLPNLYGTVKNIRDTFQSELTNLYGSQKDVPSISCSLSQKELSEESKVPSTPQKASHSLRKLEVIETLSQKQGFCCQPSQQSEKDISDVAAFEIRLENVPEESMEDERHFIPQLHVWSSDKEQLVLETASAQKGEDCNYSEVLEELSTSRIKSRMWNICIGKLCSSLTAAQPLPFIRNCIEFILRADPNEQKEMTTGLPPSLYKLFQIICVLELRLELPPLYLRNLILRVIHDLICKPYVNLQPHSLACLTAWYTASVSIPDEHGVQQWELARTFIIDMLLHYPGTIHLALLSAVSTSKKIFLRIVKYRDGTGLERVLLWVAYYGAWTGCVSVREKLMDWLKKYVALQKPPPEDPTTLAHDLLTQLTGTSDTSHLFNLMTSIVVLACWLGKLWIRKHLLPTIIEVTTKYAEDNRRCVTEDEDETSCMEESERQSRELISCVTPLLDDVGVELKEALMKLLRLPPNTLESTQ
ncbi:uncharacterized protein [Panulirus ornatus]|uniref:uncharacterized protein isoform X2 n=1 Tax=Panulirus ornatus TaxID=150431 RepID=UPI003A89975A